MGRLKYLLDTNVLSEPTRVRPDQTVMRHIQQRQHRIATASIVVHELHYGILRLAEGVRKRSLTQYLNALLLHAVPILPYDKTAALWHAQAREQLARSGNTASFPDGQIAAIAVVNELVLVTRNDKDFLRFPELVVENWFAD